VNWIEIVASIAMIGMFIKVAMVLVEEFYEDDFE